MDSHTTNEQVKQVEDRLESLIKQMAEATPEAPFVETAAATDIYVATACRLFLVTPDRVMPWQRKLAKQLLYGLAYTPQEHQALALFKKQVSAFIRWRCRNTHDGNFTGDCVKVMRAETFDKARLILAGYDEDGLFMKMVKEGEL